jgi:hypothetical protein
MAGALAHQNFSILENYRRHDSLHRRANVLAGEAVRAVKYDFTEISISRRERSC